MRVIHSHRIGEEAEVGAARRAVRRFAAPLGFGENELSDFEIVVQEIGTNAARYAGGGCVHWTTVPDGAPGVEIFYCDKGPGIDDPERAVRDGVSTGGSLGGGFGAITRLTDEFEIYSLVRGVTRGLTRSRRTTHGTALFCRKRVHTSSSSAAATMTTAAAGGDDSRLATAHEPEDPSANKLSGRVGAWSRPRPREDVNGDAYFVRRSGAQELFAVVDGLGHGRGAHEASRVALDSLAEWDGEPLDEVFNAVHGALRATRGAVMAACVIDTAAEAFSYAGVGNVEVRVFNSPDPIRPVPNNGTLGARMSNVRVWRHAWSEGATLVMSSDGLSAKWDISSYPGLLAKSPQMLAGVLMRDYARDSDDSTVLVAR